MKKRYGLFFFTWAIILVGIVVGGTMYLNQTIRQLTHTDEPSTVSSEENTSAVVPVVSKSRELVLQRTYLCGVKEDEQKKLTNQSMEKILATYTGWEIVSVMEDKVVLHRRETDLAPICKENGYFGLTQDGILTLFNGLPGEQNVIQTFYQLNTDKMEVSLPTEEVALLKKGIRVRDLAEYNSVLSTFGAFQIGESEFEGH